MTKVNAKAGAIITTARAHMPRQSIVNSDVKSSSPTGSVFEFTERVSCEASANSFQEVRKAKIAAEAMPGPRAETRPAKTLARACSRQSGDLHRSSPRHLTKKSVDKPDGERHIEGDESGSAARCVSMIPMRAKMMKSGSDSAMPGTGSSQHEPKEKRRLSFETVACERVTASHAHCDGDDG